MSRAWKMPWFGGLLAGRVNHSFELMCRAQLHPRVSG